jgi:hypothetical protein
MGSNDVRRALITLLIGGWRVAAVEPASAQQALPVHLTYEAPSGCPGEKDFTEMVAADGGRLVLAPEGDALRAFVLQVTGTSPSQARLVIRERDGSEPVRVLSDSRCEAVVRAAAVVVALSLDAPLPPLPPPDPPSAEPADESLEPLPPVPGIAAGGPLDALAPDETLSRDEAVSPDESSSGAAPPARHAWRFDVSGEGVLGTGAVPVMNSGLAAYAELFEETPALFAPAVRVGFQLDRGQSLTDPGVPDVGVRRTVGRVDACPLRVVASRPWATDAFTVQLCARVDVGKMDVQTWVRGTQVDEPQLWLATAGLFRFRWMTKAFFVELEGGVVVPIARTLFTFGTDPYPVDPRDFEIPQLAGTTGLGLGLIFL